MGSFLKLFMVASMPVLKMLLLTAIGLFLALKRIDILGDHARHHLNKVVFYVFGPALVGGYLAKTVTFKSFLTLWFMPVNILITFIIGSALGWLVGKITKSPNHIKGLILSSCSAGNLGVFVLIIVPAICKEKGSPFGASHVCETYGLAYASLSMAIGSIYMWLYVYNILRIYSRDQVAENKGSINEQEMKEEPNKETLVKVEETQSTNNIPYSSNNTLATCDDQESKVEASVHNNQGILPSHSLVKNHTIFGGLHRIKEWIRMGIKRSHLKSTLTPSTIAAIVGFFIGMISPFRKILIGEDAHLHVISDTASTLGDATIPCLTLILGANLLTGLKGTKVEAKVVMGIVVVRYLLLPILGILITKTVVRAGLVPSNHLLFHFILMLQYALPPAMGIGTMTQLFGAGQSEYSVIVLWTYALSSIALSFWCTIFLWLLK